MALKLWLITSPRWCPSTYCSAATICGKPCTPSVSDTGVSTSSRFAPGAITCAHSTSSVVSPAQPTMSELPGLYAGTGPAGWMIWNLGGAGRPKALSNTLRSFLMVGEPKESTMTIVVPLPVTPRAYSGGR